jgi:hypothetical protein
MGTLYGGMPVKARCPKCKAANFRTMEVYEEVVICLVKNGVFPHEAEDHQPGRILGISCECDDCGHRWKPRGAKTLSDLIDD